MVRTKAVSGSRAGGTGGKAPGKAARATQHSSTPTSSSGSPGVYQGSAARGGKQISARKKRKGQVQKQDKGGKKKKSRRGNSLVELRFLRRLNKHGGEGYTAKDLLCTAKSQFRRVVRDYILHHAKSNLRETKFRVHALLALQEAAESYLVTLFEHMNLVAIHAKRKTVLIKDLALIRTMRSMDQTLNPMK